MFLNSKIIRRRWLVAAVVFVFFAQAASAQTTGTRTARATGGWKASSSSSSSSSEQPSAVAQAAFFQSQANFSDSLPGLPPGFLTTPASANQPPSLPADFANSGQILPPGAQAYAGGQALPANQSYSSATNSSPIARPAADRSNGQVYPPEYSAAPAAREQVGTELRPIQHDQPKTQTPNPRLRAQDITSGLPFVTPAPRGNYPTMPYQPAVFQASSRQSNGFPAQLASNATPSVSNYLTAQQSTLPQYIQPGIYPTAYQCTTPVPSFPSTGQVPGSYIPPTLTPNLTPGLYSSNNSGYSPIFSLGQENYNVLLGRGIIGQPTVYVPGQPIRNFLRYLSP